MYSPPFAKEWAFKAEKWVTIKSLIEVWGSHDGECEDQLLIKGSRAELCGVPQDLNSSNF